MAELLVRTKDLIAEDSELVGISKALQGEFIEPAAGGDLLKNPDVLPTGRNIHGFDPFRMPSAFATLEGARQADQILQKAVPTRAHYQKQSLWFCGERIT